MKRVKESAFLDAKDVAGFEVWIAKQPINPGPFAFADFEARLALETSSLAKFAFVNGKLNPNMIRLLGRT